MGQPFLFRVRLARGEQREQFEQAQGRYQIRMRRREELRGECAR
ncbi:hypothetical protein [Tumebacillus lipolyticus]|uniref:Uncharacterized protein n=1 Tax=Tumebacillus lipolyticus TaxID=1280370 RepID=A0ABW4ZVJ5_9BACL